MTEYAYQVHMVTEAEYEQLSLLSSFQGGVIVEGCAGMENDCLIITARVTLRDWPQLEDHRGKDV